MFKLFAFLLFFQSGFAWGLGPCELQFLTSQKHLEYFEELNSLWLLKIKRMELESSRVSRLSHLEQEVEGKLAAGIFTAHGKDGESVLKVLKKNKTLDKYAHKILLQKHFGDLGLAPKVKGVYALEDLKGLKEKFPEVNPDTNLAILMEKVEGKFIKKISVDAGNRPDLSGLPDSPEFKAKVRDRLKLIEKSLNDLEVATYDIQVMITKEGDVYLLDYDFYDWTADVVEREMGFRPTSMASLIDLFY